MFTVREFSALEEKVSKQEKEIISLRAQKARNEVLKTKNSDLSRKCESFRGKNNTLQCHVDNMKAKQQIKVKVVVGFLLDGDLKLTDQQVADKLFVDIAYIKNMKSVIRRERK